MKSMENPESNQPPDDAAKLAARWFRTQPALEAERLRRLRSLSERDAAEQFARLLQSSGPYPLRPTSGLVEQQRILARLRNQS
jgi:hypothetical protein